MAKTHSKHVTLRPGRQCTYVRADGRACRAWAVRGRERCVAHGGLGDAEAPWEALLDALIVTLAEKQAGLVAGLEGDDLERTVRLVHVLTQSAAALGRLLRDRQAISSERAAGITSELAAALEELSGEAGLTL